ncbi:uncharacterized protein I206_105321 [Kwoniella pini CBS 10737]|uniref:Kinetochore protein Mis13/DSN1 n=1 Tax=Kwoniella pini CBS 10737 TaxID=1296096 RepID=A0A1B9I4J6_9TREE|nr:uncharacterized protein I206_03769 [Kwoniella pini CBS 10737]OCF50447.1 hypothetical protein I206_03769 [Kwoniella pini CBS 10737]
MATRTTIRPIGVPTALHTDFTSNMVSGKRKSMSTNKVIEEDEPDKKKRKPATKKQSNFKPQPVPTTHSSDTPPDVDDDLHLLPPPSERKIARRRESTREIRERHDSPTPSGMASTSSTSNNKRSKISRGRSKSIDPIRAAVNTSDDPLGGVEETENMKSTNSTTSAVRVDGLNIPNAQPSRPSGPRPRSPPRRTFSASQTPVSTSAHPMGPPKGSFVRKTRQSMGLSRVAELSKESVVPVMESETPIIRKNQELRGQQARRSSLDHRGGRASSSWGRGEITMPHKNVDSKLFYRHIPVSYPEPIKARMLLVWCANRAMEESLRVPSSSKRDKGKGRAKSEDGRTEEGDKMLKEIMDEFVREMNRGGVDTSVFGVPGQESTVSGLMPHPRNVSNRKVEAAANADIRKFKAEEAQWSALVSMTKTKQSDILDKLRKSAVATKAPDMSKAEPWMRDALNLAEDIIAQGDSELESKGEFEDVEFKIDTLHQTSHVALQYVLQSSRFLDGIFSSLTSDLRARDRLGDGSNELPENSNEEGPDTVSLLSKTTISASSSSSKFSSTKKMDPMNLLRLLAEKESEGQDEKILEKAMSIPPVTLSSGSGSSTNTTSATPRRPTNTNTPGRPTGLLQTPRSRRGLTPGQQGE